ncbi:UDP-N-acetylmuramoyl-L-alanyl-D-glutamate--2,6-diaminopimelate ligase [soil metagenome]
MSPPQSTVGDLARSAGELLVEVRGPTDQVITGLAYDSRRVGAGDAFTCVVGLKADGHQHAGAAVAAGASALISERVLDLGVPEIVVTSARRALGRLAAELNGQPGARLELLGITGTNGKTTTVYLLESICRAARRSTGLIGTIECKVAGASRPGVRTTPDSLELQGLLTEMEEAGVTSVVMEVTSHALVLHRVEGLCFESVAFTNLSQDHLDFHHDMEDYFAAKKELFTPQRARRGAVNCDDVYGRKLLADKAIELISFGLAPDANVRGHDVRLGRRSNDFVISVKGVEGIDEAEINVVSGLVGEFNVSNCLAACAAALGAGMSLEDVQQGLAEVGAVPGRFEPIDQGQPFALVVDYAHTPDSLDNVLAQARRLASYTSGRVVCVFGCGGDRDRGKRPLMGVAAARGADVVIVTSDNPRSEDPEAIIAEILKGVQAQRAAGADAVFVGRADAIAAACALARPGDVVAICGKGHETGQEFADATIPFDDRIVARAALQEAGW